MLKIGTHEVAVEHMVDVLTRAVFITDYTKKNNPIIFANPAFTALTGYRRDEIIDRDCRFLWGPDTDRRVAAEIGNALTAGVSIQREILNYRKNGEPFWNDLTIDPIVDDAGAVVGFIGMPRDATASRLVDHDPLTGLSNRVHFRRASIVALRSCSRHRPMSLVYIDIHAFREINATLGQSVGDDVLREMANRLNRFADERGGIVARVNGDEFAVLFATPAPGPSTGDVCQSLCHDVARPMHIQGHQLVVPVCIGAAIFPSPDCEDAPVAEDSAVALMKRAALALVAAKREGPGTCRFHAAAFDERARKRLTLGQSLHRAIDEQQFELRYQPLVELSSGRIVGAEALVRWNHPALGTQPPDVFIPLAEASGLIAPLGAWVTKEAFRQRQAWTRRTLNPPRIAINVSSIQLRKPGFIDAVEQALSETGADPEGFEFELTEGLLIDASDDTMEILTWIKAQGFGLTIDDFGAGYSTFKYIRDFPVDKIKIDQTFIRQLAIGSIDASIIRAMIILSRNLGISVVAEGIETVMQRDFLIDEGCEIGQGYLFSLPLIAEDFGWLLKQGLSLPVAPPFPAGAPPRRPPVESRSGHG